jgi:hypothetical protein
MKKKLNVSRSELRECVRNAVIRLINESIGNSKKGQTK